MSSAQGFDSDHPQVLEFDHGVRAYPPAGPGGYWRLRWVEDGRRRDTTARSREEALAKAAEVVGGLARGRPTDWALSRPGARIEDVSRLLGHSTVRITQDLYISADGDLYERFFTATEQ